jgi:uncharacterized protein involved in propanediol utilization
MSFDRSAGRLQMGGQQEAPRSSVPAFTLGYGKAFASFGELIQGRLSTGDDLLITLPVDMWSACEVTCTPINGPSIVRGALPKSQKVAERMLAHLDKGSGCELEISFTRDIPIGKGLSSSTADMLAVLRALQEIFGVIVTDGFVSRLFSRIEPHDALHFYMSVAYNHREGTLIRKMYHIPQYRIVAVDAGGTIDTEAYNKNLTFTADEARRFDALYLEACDAFDRRDDAALARCARRATEMHLARSGRKLLADALALADRLEALGTVTAHSGTCAGFLFSKSAPAAQIERARDAAADATGLPTFVTQTLEILY